MDDQQATNESTTDKLTRHIWTTYKSRYNAYHRLIFTDKLQIFTLTTIAIYILAISVIILNPDIIGEQKTKYANIYLVILSIISLALSLTMGQSDNKAKAFEFKQCSRKLQRLYNHILMEREKNPEYKISDEEDKYNNILDRYNINHEKIDWEYFTFEKRKKYNKSLIEAALFHIKYFMLTKLIYLVIIVIPVFISIFILFY